MNDRELAEIVRRALLMIVRAIEKRWQIGAAVIAPANTSTYTRPGSHEIDTAEQ